MENMMITINENEIKQPFATFTKVIDGIVVKVTNLILHHIHFIRGALPK